MVALGSGKGGASISSILEKLAGVDQVRIPDLARIGLVDQWPLVRIGIIER